MQSTGRAAGQGGSVNTGIPGSTTRRLNDATDRQKSDNLKDQFLSNQ
jgi:hypothetical protein